MAARRSLQRMAGVRVRTLKGSNVFPETSPQNTVPFGGTDTAGNGGNFLSAPGAGFCWVITQLVVSTDASSGQGVRVTFTGNLAVTFQSPNSTTAPGLQPATLVTSPTAMAANTAFGYSSSLISGIGPAHFTISGSAYKATVGSVFNPQSAQVLGVPIDSDPAGDIG